MCKVIGFNPACTLSNQTLYYLSIVPVASWTALIVGKCKCRSVSRMTWREQLLLSISPPSLLLTNTSFQHLLFSPLSADFSSRPIFQAFTQNTESFFSPLELKKAKKKQFARTAKCASSSLNSSFRWNKHKMNWSKMEFSPSHPAAAPQMKTNC